MENRNPFTGCTIVATGKLSHAEFLCLCQLAARFLPADEVICFSGDGASGSSTEAGNLTVDS